MPQSLLDTGRSMSGPRFGDDFLTMLSSLLQVGVEFLSSSHSVQFTGLVLINKVIDVALATNERMTSDTSRYPSTRTTASSRRRSARTGHKVAPVHRIQTWRDVIVPPAPVRQTSTTSGGGHCSDADDDHAAGDHVEAEAMLQPIIQLLTDKVHAGKVLSLVLNAITLHRRVVGTRFRCTPSLRIRSCSYHCIQILSARLLLYLAQSAVARAQLMEEAALRMMIEALDYTLDPQLLCLVIQTVALLALHFPYQAQLLGSGIPDALTQLVLPSDEWYYTNHTTRFSRVVKHHAARALVYLGLARCLGPRVSLFDYQGERGRRLQHVRASAGRSIEKEKADQSSLVTCKIIRPRAPDGWMDG